MDPGPGDAPRVRPAVTATAASVTESTPTSDLTLHHRLCRVETGMTLRITERPGAGVPVLCLHCAWGGWRTWLPLLESGPGSFAGRPVILPDLRGHGGSSKPATGYCLPDYTADILSFIRLEELGRFTLAGHSLGAFIALLVAAELPDRVDAVLLEDPPLPLPRTDADIDDYWRNLDAMTTAYLALKRQPRPIRIAVLLNWEPTLWQAEAERFADALVETADGVYETILVGASGGAVVPPEALRLDVPVLVFQAGDPGPRALRVRGVAQVKTALPRMELVSIPRTGHDVLRDNPAAYRAAVARCLDG